jgi:hypothetical protein
MGIYHLDAGWPESMLDAVARFREAQSGLRRFSYSEQGLAKLVYSVDQLDNLVTRRLPIFVVIAQIADIP